MQKTEKNIEIGMGVLGIQFGMSRDEVKGILGEPDEIETFTPEEDNEYLSEVWHYDEHELSATFDEMENWRMIALAVSSPDYLFQGVNLIGLSQEETLHQIELLELGEIELEDVQIEDEDDDENSEHQVASIYDAGLNLWFENGITSEIQWGPLWEDDED
jgi:hypothetical protein